ncbi:MAG: anti-sigma factor [Phycisphaeraceae bacterium]|nr:anti-sigma factor [Phycisphaeraceae bacterium]
MTLPQLSDADARMLDLLVEHEFNPEILDRLDGEDLQRARALLELFGHLDALPAESPSPALFERLTESIDAAEDAQRRRMRLETARPKARLLRLPDALTVAALVLVALGVGWPLLASMRNAAIREQCERNMASIHVGMERFALDHDGRLPLAAGLGSFLSSGTGGSVRDLEQAPERVDWRRYRHGENLELLHHRAYIGAKCLTCPGCEKERGAMALRVPAAGQRLTLATLNGIMVADANPAMERFHEGLEWRGFAARSSANHRSQGQNVLLDDGSIRWLFSPLLPSGDSIWLPCEREDPTALESGRLPTRADDVFVTQ